MVNLNLKGGQTDDRYQTSEVLSRLDSIRNALEGVEDDIQVLRDMGINVRLTANHGTITATVNEDMTK